MTGSLAASQFPSIDGGDQYSEAGPLRSDAPCWTCRRGRVQCDRSLPTCHKCQKRSKECLGYIKPLVWNKGVASRGKMMGKDFHENSHKTSSKAVDQVASISQREQGAISAISSGHSTQLGGNLRVLIDPIFQDLKPITRYYLDYYVRELCLEAVLHDHLPSQNPFRNLMAMVQTSPLILKTILAASARHAVNHIARQVEFPPGWPAISAVSLPQASRTSLTYHAFHYKQVALAQLRDDLQNYTPANRDTIVASITLIMWLEILESGRDAWRVHVNGVKQLAQIAEPDPGSTLQATPGGLSVRKLPMDSYFFDTCISCDIMGTTLSTPYSIVKPMRPTQMVYDCLKRSEKISFLGCPADLLYLILQVNWHCWSMVQDTTIYDNIFEQSTINDNIQNPMEATYASIINKIQSFDPIQWSHHTSVLVPESDLPQRTRLASAYKSAALIYAIRVLSPKTALPAQMTSLSSTVLSHLGAIPTKDSFFKCILWPTFIAGAEAVDAEWRKMAMGIIHAFWLELKPANVANAAAVLDSIWKKADSRSGEVGGGGWMDHVVSGGTDWLFV